MGDLYLIDSCIAPAPWDKNDKLHERARRFVASIGKSRMVISVVTLGEIECGLRSHPQMDEERKSAVRASMAEYVYVLDVTRHTVRSYSEIRAKLIAQYAPSDSRGNLKKKWPEDYRDTPTGKSLGIQENDIWIAAQAHERNALLVTEDKHMDRIAGLDLSSPLRIVRLSELD